MKYSYDDVEKDNFAKRKKERWWKEERGLASELKETNNGWKHGHIEMRKYEKKEVRGKSHESYNFK